MFTKKCLIVGDGGTGKTSFIRRLITDEFDATYSATLGYEINKIAVRPASSRGFILEIWDVSGQTNGGDLLNEILTGADCAIIVFDVTSRITFNNVAIWYREIVRTCGEQIPVVIVGNKIDIPARKIKTETMLKKFPNSVKYFDISVKTKFNINEPILWIAAKLLQISYTEDNDAEISGTKLEAPPTSTDDKETETDSESNKLPSGCPTRRKRGSAKGSANK